MSVGTTFEALASNTAKINSHTSRKEVRMPVDQREITESGIPNWERAPSEYLLRTISVGVASEALLSSNPYRYTLRYGWRFGLAKASVS